MTPMERDEVMQAIARVEQALGREIADVKRLLNTEEEGVLPRLRGLELWRARMEGARSTLRWFGPVAASIAGGATSSAIILIATNH